MQFSKFSIIIDCKEIIMEKQNQPDLEKQDQPTRAYEATSTKVRLCNYGAPSNYGW